MFLAATRRSGELHSPWVSPPITEKGFENYLKRLSDGRHYGFLVIDRETGSLVGVINLNEVVRGLLQSAYLGYYAIAGYAARGLMREGMHLVIARAFSRLKLHRLEANIQPGNHRSLRLVQQCGFVREGYSRRYLKIGGRWRDHERWALLAEDWRR